MSGLLSGLWAFIRLIPALYDLYAEIKKSHGEEHTNQFFKDLAISARLALKACDPNLSVDEKRALRRQALDSGASLWGRIGS